MGEFFPPTRLSLLSVKIEYSWMLESTFQHLPGVGEKSERRLWEQGIISWDNLLEGGASITKNNIKRLRAGVLESRGRLDDCDHEYFRTRLGGSLSWRAFEPFKDHACYLDIETTGLSPAQSDVTTVCVHSNQGTQTFVLGKNMGELKSVLGGYKFIVSFNGARFDLPFLARRLDLSFPQIHLDLMYPLRSLGFRGGLKVIEKKLGLSRESDGVTGFDAVRLWRAYKKNRVIEVAGKRVGGKSALKLLVDYNREDTVNLERICDFVVGELTSSCRKHMKGV